ncbi:ABC transporter substrate-binding protein [Lachnospira multipara]|uniref:ABC transporter substrate-binding protein n=1 Tax=Lachnospira multipara TaxID=28051 RepID=UPI000485ADDC|nr:ABC transporter substrate-binding protein [Lachnospira multipara]
MRKRKLISSVLALVMAFSLAACGLSKNDKDVADNKASETVVVTDARGEVTIPANPQRIVDLSGNSDMLSILGFSVVGTANSDAYDYTKFPSYLEDTLSGAKILGYSMQSTMDIEAILDLNPDLIVISSVQEQMYDDLSDIAPTVMIELAQTDWTDDLKEVGEIFGKSDKVNEYLDSYYAEAKEVGSKIKSAKGEDATYLSFLASGGNLYIFDAAGFGSVLYEDLGLKKPEGMPQQENISLPVVSYEGLASIDADYFFAIGTEDDLAALQRNASWNAIPAVANGNVTTLSASPYFNEGYSCIGRKLLVNEIPAFLGISNGNN